MDGVLSVRNKARSKPRHVCSSLCLCSSRTRATASPVFHSSVGDTRTRQRRLCCVLFIQSGALLSSRLVDSRCYCFAHYFLIEQGYWIVRKGVRRCDTILRDSSGQRPSSQDSFGYLRQSGPLLRLWTWQYRHGSSLATTVEGVGGHGRPRRTLYVY